MCRKHIIKDTDDIMVTRIDSFYLFFGNVLSSDDLCNAMSTILSINDMK